MKIVFDDSNYREHWGKAPRGGNKFKMWAFKTDAIPNNTLFGYGKYSEAKEHIREQIRELCKGQDTVIVHVLWA